MRAASCLLITETAPPPFVGVKSEPAAVIGTIDPRPAYRLSGDIQRAVGDGDIW